MAGNDGTYEGNFSLGEPGLLTDDSNTSVSLDDATGKVNMGHVTLLDNLGTNGYTIRIAEDFV